MKQIKLEVQDSFKIFGNIEIEQHIKVGWLSFTLTQFKSRFNKKDEIIERVYTTNFSLDKEKAELLKQFLNDIR